MNDLNHTVSSEENLEQEAFNKVWEHFIVKKSPLSHTPGKIRCWYRLGREASSPVRCAVGLLIPDEEYYAALDGTDPEDLNKYEPLVLNEVKRKVPSLRNFDLNFLMELQRAHDVCVSSGNFVEFAARLKKLAERRNWTVPNG